MKNLWVDLVLVPWKETKELGVFALLILDPNQVHIMGAIINRIKVLGIEIQHIPGGCTYLCQPVDVGVNREQWED